MKYKTKDIKLTVDDFHVKNHRQIVADFLKIDRSNYSKYELGKLELSAEMLKNLCIFFIPQGKLYQ